MRLGVSVFALGMLAAGQAARAEDPAQTPSPGDRPAWSVLVSFSPSYTNNALFSRSDRRRDVYAEPDITVRLDGKLTSDISYRLYGRSAFDAFAEEREANEAFALLGARLMRNVHGWNASLTYEHRYEFEGVYSSTLFVADDVRVATARDFTVGRITLSPTAQLSYRFADVAEARRYRLDLLLPIEVRLSSRWSIVSTPFIEGYWFTGGLNEGRHDMIYSASFGLKYNISDNVSLTTSAAYERRTSNVPLRHYRDLEIGPRLDFAF